MRRLRRRDTSSHAEERGGERVIFSTPHGPVIGRVINSAGLARVKDRDRRAGGVVNVDQVEPFFGIAAIGSPRSNGRACTIRPSPQSPENRISSCSASPN